MPILKELNLCGQLQSFGEEHIVLNQKMHFKNIYMNFVTDIIMVNHLIIYGKTVLSHQMGVFQWVWFKKSEHHSIMWEDFNRHRKKSNKILFEWWYFLSIFICIFYIGLSLFCEKILKCHFFLFFPAIFSPVSFNLLNGIQKKYYFYIHWNISIYKFKCVSIKYKI